MKPISVIILCLGCLFSAYTEEIIDAYVGQTKLEILENERNSFLKKKEDLTTEYKQVKPILAMQLNAIQKEKDLLYDQHLRINNDNRIRTTTRKLISGLFNTVGCISGGLVILADKGKLVLATSSLASFGLGLLSSAMIKDRDDSDYISKEVEINNLINRIAYVDSEYSKNLKVINQKLLEIENDKAKNKMIEQSIDIRVRIENPMCENDIFFVNYSLIVNNIEKKNFYEKVIGCELINKKIVIRISEEDRDSVLIKYSINTEVSEPIDGSFMLNFNDKKIVKVINPITIYDYIASSSIQLTEKNVYRNLIINLLRNTNSNSSNHVYIPLRGIEINESGLKLHVESNLKFNLNKFTQMELASFIFIDYVNPILSIMAPIVDTISITFSGIMEDFIGKYYKKIIAIEYSSTMDKVHDYIAGNITAQNYLSQSKVFVNGIRYDLIIN